MVIESKKLKLLFEGMGLAGLINKNLSQTVTFAKGGHEFFVGFKFGREEVKLTSNDFTLKSVKENHSYTGTMTAENRYVSGAVFTYELKNPPREELYDLHVSVCYAADEKTETVKKHLEIQTEQQGLFLTRIDLGAYFLQNNIETFSVREQKKVPHIPAYIASLGQPVYIESMFLGIEFPTADNKVKDLADNKAASFEMRFGKPFAELADGGTFVSDKMVLGAAGGKGYNAVRKSFFEYITETSRQAEFRLQYNGWFDLGLDTSSEKTVGKFRETAEGFKKAGSPALDCYVMDDGWVDYKKGFWRIDEEKFPNGLSEVAKTAQNELGAGFGLWFSPRGGYTQNYEYAKLLAELGYGINKASKDVCAAHKQYIADLTDRMIELMKEYNITYLKLDGFASEPCRNPAHGHVTEGLVEFYTELWKNWLFSFDKMRKEVPGLFINLTSYSHPSPWFMKWADAIWLGNSSDVGFSGQGSDAEQAIYYRDMRYFDIFEDKKYQIPPVFLYNHDPAYGAKIENPNTPKKRRTSVEFSADEFEKYMYMCVMRGNALHEMYLSPGKMDAEKYKIASNVLKFARYNFETVRNCVFFGDESVYGYKGGFENKGLLLVRNGTNKEKQFALTQNDIIDMFGKSGGYTVKDIYPYETGGITFGEGSGGFRTALKPFEMRLMSVLLV